MANESIPVTMLDWPAGSVLAAMLAASVILFALVWAIHVKIRDAGVVDLFWGASFAVSFAVAAGLTGTVSMVAALVGALVLIWAARLTTHMVRRLAFAEGEDARYAAMRARTGSDFWWKSLFKVYLVQAVIQVLLAAPIAVAVLAPSPEAAPFPLGLGVVLFVIGFVLEAIADEQLRRFKSKPENRGRLLTEGLFRYSRHPNYFGEMVLWWGVALVAYAGAGSLLAFLGPALLTLLLLKVSGVELLDAHLAATKPGYTAWAARTSAFVPLPPRRGTAREAAE